MHKAIKDADPGTNQASRIGAVAAESQSSHDEFVGRKFATFLPKRLKHAFFQVDMLFANPSCSRPTCGNVRILVTPPQVFDISEQRSYNQDTHKVSEAA